MVRSEKLDKQQHLVILVPKGYGGYLSSNTGVVDQNLQSLMSFHPVQPLETIRAQTFPMSQTNLEHTGIWKGIAPWHDTKTSHFIHHYSPGRMRNREC